MLHKLFIRNYAIIDELEISFCQQLNVITGETGAGKSIIAGALGLILGERADSSVLVNREKKCVVEGVFTAESDEVKRFLKDSDLDSADELVIRREISIQGRSRAFVNDTPVNLEQLYPLSRLLVDLHQQFDTLSLGEQDFQREVLDALAQNGALLKEYRKGFLQWQQSKKMLDELTEEKNRFDKEADYNQFQFNELEEAGFKINELEEIETELKFLTNAEGIREALDQAYFQLKGSDSPIVQQLKILLQQLSHFSNAHANFPALLERLESAQIELADIADSLETISAQVDLDPGKIEKLNGRLTIGYRLLKKHGVKTTRELLNIQEELEKKLQAVLDIDEAIKKQENEVQVLLSKIQSIAEQLSSSRKKQIVPFETRVNKLLGQVGMPNARIKVAIQAMALNEYGSDEVEFLFNANVPPKQKETEGFFPVKKVASGGELHRLMLCIKSLVASTIDLPTLIFDEIDSGISGEAARQVGMILKELSTNRQIICITHQPQIAGKASTHFFVYKEIAGNMVRTNIRELNKEERITTIAKMLSGEKPTAAAIENAREMLMN